TQVLLFLTQIEADHALTSACGSPRSFIRSSRTPAPNPGQRRRHRTLPHRWGVRGSDRPECRECPGPNAHRLAGCRIHGEVWTTKATNIRHELASIRNDFD